MSQAALALEAHPQLRVRRQASLYESEPVGFEQQPWFLNTVVEVETALAPLGLLAHCKGVETALGRVLRRRWGPREIDVDLLLYGNWIVQTPELSVPHARLRERRFVLLPLLELAPEKICPQERRRVSDLVAALKDVKKVTPFTRKF